MFTLTCLFSFLFMMLGPAGDDLDNDLKAAAAYRFGDSRAPLQRIENFLLQDPAGDELRTKLAARMAALLDSESVTLEGKRFFCRQLGFIGSESEVPALAALLGREVLALDARSALELIPGEASAAALRNALARTEGTILVGLILALGELKDEQSIESLVGFLRSEDRAVAEAAMTALGKIKGDQALGAIFLPPAPNDAWSHAVLACCIDYCERSGGADARLFLDALLRSSCPESVRAGTFKAMLRWNTRWAQARAINSLKEDNPAFRRAVLGYLQEHEDPVFSSILGEEMSGYPEEFQVGVFQLQLRRGRLEAKKLEEMINSDLCGAVRKSATAALLERAMSRLDNLALKGKAESPDGLECDGAASGDQAGIDGDPATYWDEADNQPLYRFKVVFDAPETISALRITGWSHHDFAPREFEVLLDDRVVKKVENAIYSDNRYWVLFPGTPCRTVELKITGYYGRSPAIRELEIFNLDESFPRYLLIPGRPSAEEIPIPLAEYEKIEAAAPASARAVPAKKRKLLVFSRSWGYKHSAIPYGDAAIEVMSRTTGAFEATITYDLDLFEKESLGQFDAIVFNNTNNEIFLPENFDKLPPEEQEKAKAIDERLKRNLVDYLWNGGGLAVTHAGVASFRKWPEFGEIIGARFDNHPWNSGSTVVLKVDDPDHPAAQAFVESPTLEIIDEIYQLKGKWSREKVRVLVSLDMDKTKVTEQQRKALHREDNDFAMSYVKSYGQGRIFYCAFGHDHDLFWNPVVLQHYLDGIQFALGDLEGSLTSSRQASAPSLSWRGSKDGLALLDNGRIVWQLIYDRKLGRAYFHPLSLLDGAPLTWLCPPDHVWHRALWFSWKFINGVNYWEPGQDAGKTELEVISERKGDDFSARIELAIDHHPPGQDVVMKEHRVLELSPPDAAGRYTIDWQSNFTALKDLELNRTPPEGEKDGKSWGGYAGMSARIAKETSDWRIVDSEGRNGMDCHRQPARWIGCGFTHGHTGKKATLAILDSPSNARHPPPSFIVHDVQRPFIYYSPAVLFNEPLELAAGESLKLCYRIVVSPGDLDSAAMDKEWKRFAGGESHEK